MTIIDHEFIDISPRTDTGQDIYGASFSGEAELRYAENGDPREFYVSAVRLNGGLWITRKQAKAVPHSFDAIVFKIIADELENGSTVAGRMAQADFSEQVDAEMEGA